MYLVLICYCVCRSGGSIRRYYMRTHARTCAYGSCVSCVFRTRTIRTIRAYFVRIVRILCVFCTRTIRTIVRISCVSCVFRAYFVRILYAHDTHDRAYACAHVRARIVRVRARTCAYKIRTKYARNTHDENIKCSLYFRKRLLKSSQVSCYPP